MARGHDPRWDSPDDVPGGTLIRGLRQAAGQSLMELANRLGDADVHVDAAHLQRIETSRIVKPAFETIDAILTAGLDASFRTRRDVLESFGYRLPWALPTEREIAEGRRLCAQELASTTWPAYLMDSGQRIWDWNRYMPRILDLDPDDPAMSRFVGITPLDLAFNPEVGTNLRVANSGTFLPQMLQMVKIQTQPHAGEPWFLDLIARARAWPGFSAIWDGLVEDADAALATQPIRPIDVLVPGAEQPLRFRIALIYLTLDPRFQVVHWIPYGESTMRHVAQWAAAEGEM